MEEAEVYINARLRDGRVNGKATLLNPKIKGAILDGEVSRF